MKTEPLLIVYRKTEDLVPYARNARLHDDAQITKLAASIKEFGFTTPLLIDATNGVICGHGRLAAAKKVGLQQVPCIVCSNWEDAKKRAYILADNRLALDSFWDYDLLKVELEELKDSNFDRTLTGFEQAEIDQLETPEIDDRFFGDVQGQGEADIFEISFTFPLELKEEMREFVRKTTKETIQNRIIEWAKTGKAP